MKSIYLIAALALPLAACGSTSKSSVRPVVNDEAVSVAVEEEPVIEAPASLDPIARTEMGCEANARNLGLFQQFGLTTSCIGAASVDDLPAVAGALVSQDKASLVTMCSPDGPQAFVMPRGTWLEVVATGAEVIAFGERDLEVELLTCEVVAAPEDRHVGSMVTLPVGWVQGRIVVD